MRGERLLRLAVAVGILVIWGISVLADGRNVSFGVTVMAFIAAGAVFGADLIVSIIHAWRGSNWPTKKEAGDD